MSVPVPFLVKPPVPVTTPLNVVSVLLPPPVSRPEPSEIVPAPANEPTMSSNVARLSVASALTLTADVSAILFAAPSASVPAETVVVPVYVLVDAPENVRVPVPTLVKLNPTPETTPDIVPVFVSATCTVDAALIVTAPLSVPI